MKAVATICAVATPPGQGGVGIVRISGPEAEPVLRALCPGLPQALPSHKLTLTRASSQGVVLDEVMAVVMRAPRSYTGEDVVELHGHGGELNMSRLLEATCALGARLAEPGEFTRRAFLNGRLDLTQAEAVADIIHAHSEAALKLAQRHLAGALGQAVTQMQTSLVEAVTLTEAAIDFSTEEHVYQLDAEALVKRLSGLRGRIEALLGTFDAGRQLREGVRVVILGRPNAGKSTLFNHLCGQPRAIVTEVPGTTRDFLEERVMVGGVALALVDTAGVRETPDRVERLGVARSLEQAAAADVILWLIDGSEPWALEPEERAALEAAAGRADVLAVINKADRPQALDDEALNALHVLSEGQALRVSLLEGRQGLDALLATLGEVARRRLAPAEEGAVITRLRHREALGRALEAMERAEEAAESGLSHEFVALDLRLALEAVGELVGQVTVDDILHRIFSDFCVGK